MSANPDGAGRFPSAYLTPGSSSFIEFLGVQAPELLPGRRAYAGGPARDGAVAGDPRAGVIHGTTIVALTFDGGVLMAGDRRATSGNVIAQRDIEKVFPADEYSSVAFAGAAGFGVEMVRLFQLELEHYEKIEGTTLSLHGKANRLSTLLRGNLTMAMQGFAAVPLFAGHDPETGESSIFSYDVTGNRAEEWEFHSIGSGSPYARGALKKLFRESLSEEEAVIAAVQALYDAADDDSATGGPDLSRGIYPTITTVSADGFRKLTDEEAAVVVRRVVEERLRAPNGPNAPVG